MDQQQFQVYAQNVLRRFFQMTNDPDKIYAIQQLSSGDLIVSGCLMYTLLPRFNKKSVVIVAQERYRGLDVQFDGVSDIIYMNHIDLAIVANYFHQTKQYVSDRYFFAGYRHDKNGNDITDKNLPFVNAFKRFIFELPLDVPLHVPIIKDITEDAKLRLHQKYVIDKNRTVIVAPLTGSGLHVSTDFWFLLIDKLKEKYIVYNNIGKTPANTVDRSFPNALPLNVSHNELAYLAGKVKCIVGMRSGLFDILSFVKGNLICMIKRDWRYVDLELNFPQAPAHIRSVYFDFELFLKLRSLMAEFDIDSMDVHNLHHKTLKNIYWTEETLFNAILRLIDEQ